MNLYEYKLVVGKIKVKKYEVTDGRTSYKLNASSSNCFEYNDSNNLAKRNGKSTKQTERVGTR